MSRTASRYYLLAMLVQMIWGLTPSASRLVLDHLDVEVYAALRYSVSGCLFLAFTLARNRRLFLRGRELPRLAALGVACYGLNSLGTLYGLKLGGVLSFSLASSLNAVVTAGVAIVILRERVGRGFAIGAALSVLGGLALAVGKYEVSGFEIAAGSLALIVSAYVFEALGFVFSRRYKERLPLLEYIAVLQLSAGAFLWTVAGATGSSEPALSSMPLPALGALAFVCVVSCCLCYLLLYWLLNHLEGHKLAFFDCFHTLVSVGLGVAVFDERLNGMMVLGGGMLLVAVYVVSVRREKPKSKT